MPANLENSAWPQDEECQFSFQLQRNSMPKNVQTTAYLLHSFHMLAK